MRNQRVYYYSPGENQHTHNHRALLLLLSAAPATISILLAECKVCSRRGSLSIVTSRVGPEFRAWRDDERETIPMQEQH